MFSKSQLGGSEIAVTPKHNSPHRAANQTAYGFSIKSDLFELGTLAPLSECGEGDCPVE